jgi:hypothetical protein
MGVVGRWLVQSNRKPRPRRRMVEVRRVRRR